MRMRIPVVFGTSWYGRLQSTDGWVATRFFHVWFLPLVPLGGARLDENGEPRGLAPLHVPSMLLAWFKIVGLPAAVGLYLWGRASLWDLGDRPGLPSAGIVQFLVIGHVILALVMVALTLVSWTWPRRGWLQLGAIVGVLVSYGGLLVAGEGAQAVRDTHTIEDARGVAARFEKILAHQPNWSLADHRSCPDGDFVELAEERRVFSVATQRSLKVALGRRDDENDEQSDDLLRSFGSLEPITSTSDTWGILAWRDAVKLMEERPWLVVIWPGQKVSLHDTTSGKAVCWREANGKGLREAIAGLSTVLRAPWVPAGGADTGVPSSDLLVETLTWNTRSQFDPILKQVVGMKPSKSACDDTAIASRTANIERRLLLVDHHHLFRFWAEGKSFSRKWMASPELLAVADNDVGLEEVRKRRKALARFPYLGVFVTNVYGNDVPLEGHLVIFDLESGKHVCTTDEISASGKDTAAKARNFRARAASRLAEVTSVLVL